MSCPLLSGRRCAVRVPCLVLCCVCFAVCALPCVLRVLSFHADRLQCPAQLAFYDTPGILHPSKLRKRMTREMATSGLDVADGVDHVMVVVDASREIDRQMNAVFVLEQVRC